MFEHPNPGAADPASAAALDYAWSGDAESLSRALSLCADAAFTQARRLLRNEADAEDAVQDAFISLARMARRYDGSSPFAAWVSRRVHFAGLDQLRLRRRRPVGSGSLGQVAGPEAKAVNADAEAVAHAVGELPERFRSVVDLHYFGGLSHADTASVMGLTISAVKMRLLRAREVLRRRLTGTVAGEAGVVAVLVAQPMYPATPAIHATISGPALHAAAISGAPLLLQKGWSLLMHHPMLSLASISGLIVAAALTVAAAERPAGKAAAEARPAGMPAEFIQWIGCGRDGVPALRFAEVASVGDCIYATGMGATTNSKEVGFLDPGMICCFKRDGAGKLSYVGNVAVPTAGQGSPLHLCAAGGRLYVLFGGAGDQIAWYDLDPTTRVPVKKGQIDSIDTQSKGSYLEQLIADPEGKTLYTVTNYNFDKVGAFRIEADGKPVRLPSPTELSIADKPLSGSLCISPDGKNAYAINGMTVMTCFDRKPTGELVRTKALTLAPERAKDGATWGTPSAAGMSPDGKWLYVSVWNGGFSPGYFAVLKRDPATGELTLQEGGSSFDSERPDFRLANSRGLSLVFLPDGSGGYIGTNSGSLLRSFSCDRATGRLQDISDLSEVDARQYPASCLLLDSRNGFLYGTGAGVQQGLWVAKAAKTATKGSRLDLKTPLVGKAATSGPAAAADWPRWHGPDGTAASPLKGIRKDWTGGLKKVWEVAGLSPGTCTWSSLAVKGDKVVVMGRHGNVDEIFCFDADKGGAPLWVAEMLSDDSSDYGWGDGPTPTPCIGVDKVYVAGKHGRFACLNLVDGKVCWEKNAAFHDHGYGACALAWEDLVLVVGGENKELAAYRKDTGENVWSFGGELSSQGTYSPLPLKIDGKDQILCLTKAHVYGIDPRAGKPLWDFPLGNRGLHLINTPAVEGNTIFALGGGALRIENGGAKDLWAAFKNAKFNASLGDQVIAKGNLYGHFSTDNFIGGGGDGGCLACIDLGSGEVRWTENVGNGTLLAVDGCLLSLTYAGDLLLTDPTPAGFKKLAEHKGAVQRVPWMHHGVPYEGKPAPFWAMLAVARGKVYIHYSDQLVCYDLMP